MDPKKMRKTCSVLAVAAATLFLLPGLWAAIDRGAVRGTVTDPQGAVVPNATITITNVERKVTQTVTTNDAGFYNVIELVPGEYTVHVEASGFGPVEFSQVIVKAGDTVTVDAALKVGGRTEKLTVTAAAPLVETAASNFTTASLASGMINELPLVGRDPQTLVQLIPGVTQSTGPTGSVFGFDSQFGGFPDPQHLVGSGISVNGSQGGANAWYLDGSLNAALGAENVVVNPSPDAIGEFNVVNNGLAPEYGRTSGAVINVVLKSGTNELHGNAYEFNRNSFFSATNPFARRDAQGRPFLQPQVNFNNFGGTLGGPVYLPHLYNGKNRTFFFVSYDVQFLHESRNRILTVPLPNEKQGDFRGDPRFDDVCDPVGHPERCLYDPYTTTGPDAEGLFHRTPFATPVIPTDRIDPLAAFYVSSFPDPNFVDPLSPCSTSTPVVCDNFIGAVGSSQTTHNISIKIDHQASDKHKLFAEWLFNPSYYQNFKYPWNGATAQTQTGAAGAQPYRTINQIFALGLTSTLSPTFINEARVMFSRQNQIATPNPDNVTQTSEVIDRVKDLNFVLIPPFQVVPNVSYGEPNLGIGVGWGPQQWQNGIQGVQAYTLIDNVTKILGKHTLKGGLMFRRDNNWNHANWGFGLGFGGGLTSDPVTGGGSGLAQFLLGAVDPGSGTGTYHAPWQTNDYWGLYVQDEYRLTPNFTLNVGVRWDLFGWFRERYDDVANFDFNSQNPEVPYPGRLGYFGTPSHPDRNVFPAHKNSFGPRLAFSWSPFGDRKTVIRGGFGLVYSNGISVAFGTQNGAISSPAYANYVGYPGDYTGQRPAFRLSDGAPPANLPALDFAKQTQEQFLGTTVGGFLQGKKDPYTEQWSLYVQRELGSNMALSVGYVGTYGFGLYGDEFRSYDYVPTATRLQYRNNINNEIACDPAIGAIYGYGATCPAYLVSRPFPQYNDVTMNTSPDGYSRYHSLQVKFDKRYSQGLQFLLAYTIQKTMSSPNTGSLIGNTATPTTFGRTVGRSSFVAGAISGGSANGAATWGGGAAEDPDNRRRYRALAPDDIPQILNMAVVYELPFGVGKRFLNQKGVADRILGGWKLVQNWNFQSGVPLTFNAPCNNISCRPNLIGDPSAGRSGKTLQEREQQWYNPAAFEAPFGSDPAVIQGISTGTNPDGSPFDYNSDINWVFGNEGLRPPSGRSPAFWNTDMSLAKDIHLSESKYFQVRWDVFNALNHQNLGLPNTSWCLPPGPNGETDAIHIVGCRFGQITNVQTDPRAMQFGLKFYW
ncbi:MAG: carboxypeptidase regulatory-like domain-containing protein [Terriglobia bacterium]